MMGSTESTKRPNTPASIGRTVGANLRKLRDRKRMSTRAVADAMTGIGRPVASTAITKIEAGDRRVDVDDLVALAIALEVSPVTLLLPGVDEVANVEADMINTSKSVPLTEKVSAPWEIVWRWAHGTDPLPGSEARPAAFLEENRPYDRGLKHETQRAVMDRLTDRPAVVVVVAHDDATAPEVDIHMGSGAEREAERLRRRLAEGGELWRGRGLRTGASMPLTWKLSSGRRRRVGSRRRGGGSAGMTRTGRRGRRRWLGSPTPTPWPRRSNPSCPQVPTVTRPPGVCWCATSPRLG
ncbi:helix-turn-helix transcriptional regulator [Glycomyces buryatensis]|uniref:Helix-turn-helix transcriptional regulator n=1 Tax=Glycomyces buryatensis TaxID=2570927 RepID=A0A4S8QS43_9ACTN|nr:helix-turn-helix transcriptional regulator [Glycomyces buryatensis]